MSDLPVPTQNALTTQNEISWPVAELDLVLLACDPGQPLAPNDPRYADFKALRQGAEVSQFRKELLAPRNPGQFLHACFSGHRGSGTSTELLKLKEWSDSKGFLTVHLQVDAYYGDTVLASVDFFLLTAMTVEAAMEDFGASLPPDRLRSVVTWFADVVQEDTETVKSELKAEAEAQLRGGVLSLVKLIGKFTAGLKASSDHAIKTHQRLRNYPDSLAARTEELLESANEMLKQRGRPNGLLLLFDNLNRYEPEAIDRALIHGRSLIERLACPAIFTVPIALEFGALSSGALRDCYPCSVVLPMLRLRRKQDMWRATVAESVFDESAISAMRDALGKRVQIERVFEIPKDAESLIKMSGGCIRDLMHLVTLAWRLTESESQLTTQAVEKAIRQLRATYLRQLNPDDYPRLAYFARNKWAREEVDSKETAAQRRRLLFHRYALEYLDENDKPWIDVHPLIVEIEEFQRAFAENNRVSLG